MKVKGKLGNIELEGTIKDISSSGDALLMPVMPNLEKDQLIDLDIEDVGQIKCNLAREIEGGIAVKFKLDEGIKDDLSKKN